MDFKYSKDTETKVPKQAASGEKGRQNALLVLLLVLVGGFSYVYFFTGLIRPQQVQKPAEAPVPQVVKKPLPPHEGQPAKVETPTANAQKQEPAPAKTEPPKTVQAAPAAAPAAQGTPSKVEPKQAEAVKSAEKKPVPAPAGKTAQKQSVTAKVEAKPAADKKPSAKTEKKSAGTKAGKKQKILPAEAKGAKVGAKPEKKTVEQAGSDTAGRWTVVVGNYLLEDAMATDLAHIRKAGFKAFVQPGARKKASMNRLFLAEFSDRNAAQAELDKLKRYTSDAFMLDQGGKHAVYAGSYLVDARAASEKERLAAAGIILVLRRAEVSIPTRNLTAGTFADKKTAEVAVIKLKEAGIKSTMMRQ